MQLYVVDAFLELLVVDFHFLFPIKGEADQIAK
jgi:hypothetical protein